MCPCRKLSFHLKLPPMPPPIKIISTHHLDPTPEQFNEALETMWGPDLRGDNLENARHETREHFDGLRLIVIETTPPDLDVDWGQITQQIPGVDPGNWQSPYDEELIDPARGRWAFFMHAVNPALPLTTPDGDLPLPAPTPLPSDLARKNYEVSG